MYPWTSDIITSSRFEAALDYKPRILAPKIEEFLFLVHKLSVILTALVKNGLKSIQAAAYNGARTVLSFLVQGSDGGGTFHLHFWNLHKIWI